MSLDSAINQASSYVSRTYYRLAERPMGVILAIVGIVATALVVAYGGTVDVNPYIGAEIAFLVIFTLAFVGILFEAMEYGRPMRNIPGVGLAKGILNVGANTGIALTEATAGLAGATLAAPSAILNATL